MANSPALIVNFIGLVLSIWLGVYIVTRGRNSRIAWSSGLTLWYLAGFFASILLFMFSSPTQVSQQFWVRLLFPFWPQVSSSNSPSWTQAWAAGLGLLFWYQTTVLIIPGRIAAWRRISLIAAYILVGITLILQILEPNLIIPARTDPLLVDTQRFTSPYSVYAVAFILCSALSVYNLVVAKRLSASIFVKKQLNLLIAASVLAGLATLLSIVGALPGLPIPVLWISSLLLITVGFLGVGVIRYSAFMGQRILRRDLAYSAVSISLVVFLYLVMFLWLIVTYHVPEGFVVFVIPVVILTHSLAEDVRQVIERLIYDKRTRSLRSSLRQLGRLAVEQADLDALLSRSLEAMCQPVQATQAVILVFDGENAHPTGSYRWNLGGVQLLRADFEAEDVKPIDLGSLPDPFLETTLLIPLCASLKQIGALLLGRPRHGIHYSREDLLFLQDPVDQITELLVTNRRFYDYLDQFAHLPLQQKTADAGLIPPAWVEDALQNIYDYAYLGDSPLVNLKQVGALLDGRSATHLDKGKAVYQVVSDSVIKLRPETIEPKEPIPRAWYPYLILHDAYFEGLPNRDILLKLYISEGTFHRTRRSAIRSVTRVLSELEAY